MKSLNKSLVAAAFAAAICVHPAAHSMSGDPGTAFEANFPTSAAHTRATAELEKVFWVCDYIATVHGQDKVDAVACTSATDEFKRVKFGGDFEKMLDWWRASKVTQHAAIDRAEMELASGAADATEYPDSI